MYGTCSSKDNGVVAELGATPIDYTKVDFVEEIHRLTGDGVDAVFDGIGGRHIWESRNALRRGGRVVAYGLTGSLKGGRKASGSAGRRNRFGAIRIFALYIVGSFLLPGGRRVVPYSIQTLKRLRPKVFRDDLSALFDLLKQHRIKPLIAQRLPLVEARKAHELLGSGSVTGKIVLVTEPVAA
jgi:NADPH2:quinone reductase